jgi:hypothetical protein
MSVEGFEPSTNGLKGRPLSHSAPIQETAVFTPVHWTENGKSLLDAVFKACQQPECF